MLALQEKGIDKVAVIIDALNDNRRHTKPIDFMPLTGQSFAEHRKGTNMYLHDMLPLSQRYADTARELFTNKPKSRIQFSLKDSAGKTLTKEQAEFFKDSKIKNNKGNLLKVYHATDAEFYTFENSKAGNETFFIQYRSYIYNTGTNLQKNRQTLNGGTL